MSCGTENAVLNVLTQSGAAETNVGSPPTNPTIAFELTADTVMLAAENKNLNDETISGTRSHYGNMVVENTRMVTGEARANPTPALMDWTLQHFLGGAPASSGTGPVTKTYSLSEALPCFDWFSRRGTQLFMFRECKGSSLTLSGSAGSAISMALNITGKDRDDPPAVATWPGGVAPDLTFTPWMFHSCTLTIGGTSYQIFDFNWKLDNQVNPRLVNSKTPTEFITSGRRITLDLGQPWGGNQALLAALKAASAVSVVLSFTAGVSTPVNTVRTLTLTMPVCKVDSERDPIAPNRSDEMKFPIQLKALATAPGNELSVTLVTPS